MERKILDLFLFSHKLKFNEIENALNVRSNKLSYHLKGLVTKGILEKKGGTYQLSDTSEYLIPYLSERKSPLPVMLIMIGNEINCFLHLRKKRPYKDKLGLPGGRLLISESLPKATRRIMKEKFGMDAKFEKINSISLEHVRKSEKIIYSFLLIFVSAETKDKIILTDVDGNKGKIISSDYGLIKSKKDKNIDIKTIYSNL